MTVSVEYLPVRITPDPQRVLSRFFDADEQQTRHRVTRVLSLSEEDTERIVSDLLQQYASAHPDIAAVWQEHFQRVKAYLPAGYPQLSPTRQRLLGAYFTMDYALEAVAVFNPSIVRALDQHDRLPGATRFVLSLRAVGEGHLSSVIVRTGSIDAENNITLNVPSPTQQALVGEPDPALDIAFGPAYSP